MTGFVLSQHKFNFDAAKFSGERSFFARAQAARGMSHIFKNQVQISDALKEADWLIHREYLPALERAVTAEDLFDATSGMLELCRQRFDQPVVVLLGGYLQGIIEYCGDYVTGFDPVHKDWQKRARPVEAALIPGSF
jgi:hypothetical protein